MPNLYILDVCHGNSAVLENAGDLIVIDAGLGSDLLQFLLDNNLTTIECLLLSHADKDHIGGVIGLLSSGKIVVKNVYLNTNSLKGTKIWEDLLCALQDRADVGKINFQIGLTCQLNGKLGNGETMVEVLAPSQYLAAKGPGSIDKKGRKLSSNSISAVIRLCYNDKPIAILPGDIDMVGLENLLEKNPDISAWLAVFPHHGGQPGKQSPATFTDKFCKAVNPDIIIFSIADNNKDFPDGSVVQTIADNYKKVRMLSTRSSGILLEHINKSEAGKHQNSAGTITIHIKEEYPPELEWVNH